ncbi:alpha-1,3-arabinosyltransferase XAT2-like [Macadamia integrifolia]|uniref:alpha-1,3-arabinosyltransferase XAT2-like n=1 Tax=Macadamia integrifolia TaxID=60698 RepID=UPI001C4F37BD|nr:alpha-1,3-arabinosyltransferase XAT2-like [Macadamia integrifolia]
MFSKSFNRYEHRYWSIIGFFIFSLAFFILLKPYLGPLPILNLKLSMNTDITVQPIENTNTSHISSGEVIETKQICNVSDPKFDFCDVEGDIRVHGKSSTIFAATSQMGDFVGNKSWNVKPYPRKKDQFMMGMIKEFSVNAISRREEAAATPPPCGINHSVPAVVFSVGGYAAINHWHAFTDILIPLFAASAQFQGEVKFLVTNLEEFWIMKYEAILEQLSRYEIINIDTEDQVHCFPHLIVGLQHYKELRIDPLTASKGYSMKEFRKLIRNAYSLKKLTAIKIGNSNSQEKPRLLILTRNASRRFLNVNEIAELAKSMGFEVVITEALTNLDKFSNIVNSCDVMIGIHGAGLTNFVFLPNNAILIQVLPCGGFEWLASNCFGDPALDMELRYMEYKIKEEESTLLEQYPLDHPVFKDPHSIHKDDWGMFKSVYLDKQDVKFNVSRFKDTFLEVLELLHH